MTTYDWGHLRARYEDDTSPKRILSLDGGGIRGVVTLKFLGRIEAELRASYGDDDLRLCQFFDYIGGTSTGAIIATGLARGMSVAEIETFYRDFGRRVFEKRSLLSRWKSLYSEGELKATLREKFDEPDGTVTDLGAAHLDTMLMVVMRNVTTDSAWPISSNPKAKYNALNRRDCNLRIPLWQLVRASTAAPVYFPPEVIHLDPHDRSKEFVFEDGGTTSYNNPAFLMYRMATSPEYGLSWATGESALLVVSVGTGSAPVLGTTASDPESNLIGSAARTLRALMSQAAFDQDHACRSIGRCSHGPRLDQEVGTMVPSEGLDKDLGRRFLYVRYDVDLSRAGLDALGFGREVDPEAVGRLDAVDQMENLATIGATAVESSFDLRHFGAFVRTKVWPRRAAATAAALIEFDDSRAKSYRKTTEVLAFRTNDAVTFEKSWGTQSIPAGSWIVVPLDADGRPTANVYGIDDSVFRDTYASLDSGQPNRYAKTAEVRAYQPGRAFSVRTVVDGRLETPIARGSRSAWTVKNPKGEVYPIEDDIFRSTYVAVDAE